MPGAGFRARLAALLLALLLCAAPALAGQARSEAPLVLERLPHDPAAFTQGLVLHRGVLYESTGLYGESELRRVDPATGRALERRALEPELFGEGLALCPERPGGPERLAQLTWQEGRILLWDARHLRPLGRLPLRGQGWGLACGPGGAVLSDGSHRLRWLDPRTLSPTGRELRVQDGGRRVTRLNELEWVKGWLVANVWEEDRVAVIRPDSGQVALWLDLRELRRELPPEAEAANGVAFDPAGDGGRGSLLLTGKRWPLVFVARLPELLLRPPGR